MPRQVRIEYGGAFYHVMARGNRRGDIVFDDEDRKTFLRTLSKRGRALIIDILFNVFQMGRISDSCKKSWTTIRFESDVKGVGH
jgi:hypothetical protein